jgi:uncharacterized protein YndB with AHSA1/START domain
VTQQTTNLTVHKSIIVEATQERAFAVFTAGLANWWPLDAYHIGGQSPETAVLEPRVGGRWFERAADGTECDWGHVLEWDPPRGLVLSWEINADFRPDPGTKTTLAVRFVPEGPRTTRVELDHQGLDAYDSRAAELQALFDSDRGWSSLLARFAGATQSR